MSHNSSWNVAVSVACLLPGPANHASTQSRAAATHLAAAASAATANDNMQRNGKPVKETADTTINPARSKSH